MNIVQSLHGPLDLWNLILDLQEYAFPHASHKYFGTPCFPFLWAFNLSLVANVWLHSWQDNVRFTSAGTFEFWEQSFSWRWRDEWPKSDFLQYAHFEDDSFWCILQSFLTLVTEFPPVRTGENSVNSVRKECFMIFVTSQWKSNRGVILNVCMDFAW